MKPTPFRLPPLLHRNRPAGATAPSVFPVRLRRGLAGLALAGLALGHVVPCRAGSGADPCDESPEDQTSQCTQPEKKQVTPEEAERRLKELLRAMDDAEKARDEFGTMAITTPEFALPSGNFAFSVSATPDDFYKDAKTAVQGEASSFLQSSLSAGLGLAGQFNPAQGAQFVQQSAQASAVNDLAEATTLEKYRTQNLAALAQERADLVSAAALNDPTARANAIAAAELKYSNALTAPDTVQLPSTAPTNAPALPTDLVSRPPALTQQFTGNGMFKDAQALLSGKPTPVVSDQTALQSAAAASYAKAIFQFWGDQQSAAQFSDRKVLLGVCTVSVEPGWHTQKGYAADVNMRVCYEYTLARPSVKDQFLKDPGIPKAVKDALQSQSQDLPLPREFLLDKSDVGHPIEGTGPYVQVVSPLTDTQVLDLSSSTRRERDISLSLALAAQLAQAGAQAQAQAFYNFAKSLQKDVTTISPDVVVNSYSVGPSYGFQVGPRLKAIGNPGKSNLSGAAEVLDRQSFPALLFISIDRAESLPKLLWCPRLKRYRLYEPAMVFRADNRWVPTRSKRNIDRIPVIRNVVNLVYPVDRETLSESMLIDRINQMELNYSNLMEYVNPKSPMLRFAYFRMKGLEDFLQGTNDRKHLPLLCLRAGDYPTITGTVPDKLLAGQTGTLIVTGTELDDLIPEKVEEVTGALGPNSELTAKSTGHVISVTLTPPSDAANKRIVFKFPSRSDDARFVYTPAVTIQASARPVITSIAPQEIYIAAAGADTSNTTNPAATSATHVIVSGTGLEKVDLNNIYLEPANIRVPKATCVDQTLQFSITPDAKYPAVSVRFGISDTKGPDCDELALYSPAIAVKQLPASTTKDQKNPSGSIPTVTDISPNCISLSLDPKTGNLTPATVLVHVSGSHLDLIDVAKISISGKNSQPAAPCTYNATDGSITVPIVVSDSTPVIISLPPKAKGDPIDCPKFTVCVHN